MVLIYIPTMHGRSDAFKDENMQFKPMSKIN